MGEPTPKSVPSILAQFPDRLGHLGEFDQCALVDYPLHANPGDHMLFLAALLWLSHQCDPRRIYLAHRLNFSKDAVRRRVGGGPIFCLGGGNLGDLWPKPQRFRETVIRACPEQPVVLLPQCLYFRKADHLESARAVFNAHPALTMMLRDPVSLEMARRNFDATALLTPDQSLLLAEVVGPRDRAPGEDVYVLTRGTRDREASPELSAIQDLTSGLPGRGWDCMGPRGFLSGALVMLRPRGRGGFDAETRMPEAIRALARAVDRPAYVTRSWWMVEQSIAQIDPYRLIVTDRFHGHILCALRRIPHIVIGNNHHKIESHWSRWMAGIPAAALVRTRQELALALEGATQGWR
jgi:pyruvyl transferase EpsO